MEEKKKKLLELVNKIPKEDVERFKLDSKLKNFLDNPNNKYFTSDDLKNDKIIKNLTFLTDYENNKTISENLPQIAALYNYIDFYDIDDVKNSVGNFLEEFAYAFYFFRLVFISAQVNKQLTNDLILHHNKISDFYAKYNKLIDFFKFPKSKKNFKNMLHEEVNWKCNILEKIDDRFDGLDKQMGNLIEFFNDENFFKNVTDEKKIFDQQYTPFDLYNIVKSEKIEEIELFLHEKSKSDNYKKISEISKFIEKSISEIRRHILFHNDKNLDRTITEKIINFRNTKNKFLNYYKEYLNIAKKNFFYNLGNYNNLFKFLKNQEPLDVSQIKKYADYAISARLIFDMNLPIDKKRTRILTYLDHAKMKINENRLQRSETPKFSYYNNILLHYISDTYEDSANYDKSKNNPRFSCTFDYLYKVLFCLSKVYERLVDSQQILFVKYSFVNTVNYYNKIISNGNDINYDFDTLSLFNKSEVKSIIELISMYDLFPQKIKTKHPLNIKKIKKFLIFQKQLDHHHNSIKTFNFNSLNIIPSKNNYLEESKKFESTCSNFKIPSNDLFRIFIIDALDQYYNAKKGSDNKFIQFLKLEISILINAETCLKNLDGLFDHIGDDADGYRFMKKRIQLERFILNFPAQNRNPDELNLIKENFIKLMQDYEKLRQLVYPTEYQYIKQDFSKDMRKELDFSFPKEGVILKDPKLLNELLNNPLALEEFISNRNRMNELLKHMELLDEMLQKPLLRKVLILNSEFLKGMINIQREDKISLRQFLDQRNPKNALQKSQLMRELTQELLPQEDLDQERKDISDIFFDEIWDKIYTSQDERCKVDDVKLNMLIERNKTEGKGIKKEIMDIILNYYKKISEYCKNIQEILNEQEILERAFNYFEKSLKMLPQSSKQKLIEHGKLEYSEQQIVEQIKITKNQLDIWRKLIIETIIECSASINELIKENRDKISEEILLIDLNNNSPIEQLLKERIRKYNGILDDLIDKIQNCTDNVSLNSKIFRKEFPKIIKSIDEILKEINNNSELRRVIEKDNDLEKMVEQYLNILDKIPKSATEDIVEVEIFDSNPYNNDDNDPKYKEEVKRFKRLDYHLERERERVQQERERLERERLEQERVQQERERLERERLEREQQERVQQEQERLEREQQERERLERKRLEQQERERLEQQERERLERERLERERLERERLERERLEREQKEQQEKKQRTKRGKLDKSHDSTKLSSHMAHVPPSTPEVQHPLFTNLYNSSDFTAQVLDLMDSKLEIIKNDKTLQTAYIQYVNNVIQNPLFGMMVNSFMTTYGIDENLASMLLIFLASYDMMHQAGFIDGLV